MRFNYHETYATMDSEIPREFEKIPADHHVHYWGPVWENSVEIDGKLNEALLVCPSVTECLLLTLIRISIAM